MGPFEPWTCSSSKSAGLSSGMETMDATETCRANVLSTRRSSSPEEDMICRLNEPLPGAGARYIGIP